MPALSKKQQKFMGIVRSIQKGEQPAGKFSKDAQDAAKSMRKSSVKKYAATKHKGKPEKVKSEAKERDYKEEYKKFQSSTKAKKYRAELNKYNRQKGTYGNGDGKDASHKGGKIVGFESQSKNRGRAEKSRLKKEQMIGRLKEMIKQELSEYTYGTGDIVKDVNPTCPHHGAMGKVKSVGPKSVVFVVMNKGKNFKPGMELEKSHDQMKKMNESVNESYTLYHNGRPVAGFYTNALPITKVVGTSARSYISFPSEKSIKDEFKRVLSDVSKDDRFTKQDVQKLATMFKRMKIRKNESVNEMSAKSKKIINKLGKKEKEMFIDMVDMLGFDQVMMDYKKDKKAFKQALKDMSESVIKEYVEPNQFNKNFDKAMDMVIKQANNLKGQLAKHPIKRNVNKLKAIQKLYKKFIAPALVIKDRRLSKDFDFTNIKKKLSDGKFKSALEFSIMNRIGGTGYDANSFFMLDDKTKKLKDRIYGELRKLVNILDDAQLENINEDGHTDVASSKRKVMIMVDDSNKLLNKLNGMNKEDSLPSWWSDKITLSQNYLEKATNYLLNPVESVKESMNPSQIKKMRDEFKKTGDLPPHLKKFALDLKILKKKHKIKNIVVPGLEWMSDMKEVNEGKGVEKVLKMANDQSFGKLGGRTVDALSAGLFKGVYEKAPQNAKDKINKMNEKQLYVFMTKLWSKFGNQVRIG